jgi:FkbM family methyltransferase
MHVIDVGAHVGLYTLMAARRVSRVVAFEPSRQNFKLLRKNVILSRLTNVDVRREAVTDRVGTVTFQEFQGSSWGRSMMCGMLPQEFTTPISVQSTTIDALEMEPNVLKIDVEGAEAAVLQGAANTIQRAQPIIFLEVHHQRLQALGATPGFVRSTLVGYGYRVECVARNSVAGGEHIEQWVCYGRS